MKDRAKHLGRELPCVCQLEDAWRHIEAVARDLATIVQTGVTAQPSDMRFQTIASLAIDNRADMGFDIARVADMEFAGGSRDHLNQAIRDIVWTQSNRSAEQR